MIFSYLLAAFIFIPILELWVLFKVDAAVGLGTTVLIVVLTGIVGAWLARMQGMLVMLQIRRDMAVGRMPAPRLMDGMLILIAGALLITPGLLTDTVGFLLLLPPVRNIIRTWCRRKMEQKIRDGSVNITFR